MPVIWHPPRHSPDPDLISFEIPEDGLAYNYSGETLDDRYLLAEPFGPGGTSTVYRGKDLRTGAQVAVKILNASMHEHLLGLFGQEGRVAARHTCPHLVQAIDFGKHEDCAFTVFKFVDGISLFNLGRDTPLPWRRVARVAIQILAALDDLHRRGLVHCDLHPSNVLVRRDLEGLDFATVIDLGFAFVIPPKRITGAPEPTKYIFGLRRYIAPERRAGDAPGPRSDLYSLGVLLWELLTAQILPAYELDPGLAIPPVRTIAPGLDIPEALDAIIMRALSDVKYRFRDAQEMAQALRDVLDNAAPNVFAPSALPAAAAVAAAAVPAISRAENTAPVVPAAFAPVPAPPGGIAAPPPLPVRSGLGAILSLAFTVGSAVGAVATVAAYSSLPIESRSPIDLPTPPLDSPPAQPTPHDESAEEQPVVSVPAEPPPAQVVVASPSTSLPTPEPAISRPRITGDNGASQRARVARARKGILACNPSGAQFAATVLIERISADDFEIRFNNHPILGALGECAARVARTLALPLNTPLSFKLSGEI